MFNVQSLHIAMLLWGCIFSLIAALCMFMSRNFDKKKRQWLIMLELAVAILLFSDALAWGYRGSAREIGYIVVRVSNFVVFIMSTVVVMLYTAYMSCCLFDKDKDYDVRIIISYIIAVIGIVLVIVSQFNNMYYYFDSDNYYHRNSWHVLSIFIPLISMGLDLMVLVKYRKRITSKMFVAFLSYMILPIAASVIQAAYYGMSLINIAISISMVLMFIVAVMEQNGNLARKEQEAADLKISIMMSQISPHFIYNTLTSIQAMCETDPKTAEETVGEFAQYLRGNLESLSRTDNITFEREIEHVKCYLSIVKKRFGNRVNVEYDINEMEFLIPSLTVQPIVENAVKYGLCKKKGGGTVKISTRREDNNIIIEVDDDGTGFDIEKAKEDDRLHIGIRNVRNRVEEMCNGKLMVRSQVGTGTKVTIILPQ